MSVYDRAAATAARLLAKFGRAGTLRQVTAGTYDPNTSTATPNEADHTVNVAAFDFDLRLSGTVYQPGTLIQSGDKQILMAAQGLTVTPAPGMTVIAGPDTWTVVAVKEINPAGTAVMYEILGRK